jgi:ABC-2 type transport system permease protein
MIPASLALAKREYIRFIRQPQRVIGAIGQPVLFWVFLGSGFTASFRAPGLEGVSYLEYFYPGVMLMMMLFTSIFSSITIIEDRDAGFMQGVLVAPVPRAAIVMGKVLGGTAIAMSQTLLFSLAAPFLGLSLSAGSLLLLLFGFVLTGIGFTSLGFLLAWGMKSTSGFHAVMMVFLMPLWLLSGALFPVNNAPAWLEILMTINPVSHALTILRMPFYLDGAQLLMDDGYLGGLMVTLAWAAICLVLSIRRVGRRERGVAVA